MKQKQQGDVLFKHVKNISLEGATKLKPGKRGLILADGEHTGHAHCIEEETDAELYQIGERMLLKLTATKTVTHEEHKPVTLEPGTWEIGRVREYDYFQKMERTVRD